MTHYLKRAFWGLLLTGFSFGPGFAQNEDQGVFAVSGIQVDVSAQSASTARGIALQQGQREAFSRLFQKLVAEEDLAFEPTLANEELAPLILGFDVKNERTSLTRYIAELDVAFDPNAVRSLLGGLRVSFAETKTKPVLVLPLLSWAGVDHLWGPGNIWLDAWGAYPYDASLIQYVLPENDIRDRALITPRNLIAFRPDRLKAIIERYTADDVIVAHAELDRVALANSAQLELKIYRGERLAPLLNLSYVQEAGENVEELLARAVKESDDRLSDAWKNKVLIQYGSEENIQAYMPIADFKKWREVIDRMGKINQIRSLKVDSVALGQGHLSFDFYGGMEQLLVALSQQGLTLEQDAEDRWRIAILDNEPSVRKNGPSVSLQTPEPEPTIELQSPTDNHGLGSLPGDL